jgi:glycosyltransferase involved in cell wall biosynthesis
MSRKRIIAVMPAYNAARTLEKTYRDIPPGVVDEVILVDDGSTDDTVMIAQNLGINVIVHSRNRGYGANQKTCYDEALRRGADIIVMIHPDYQYDSRLIPYLVGFIQDGICDIVLGSRIRTRREALDGGMPIYKYISNRVLTFIENIVLGQNIGDFHTGFRAYARKVLEVIPYHYNSDGFIFDTQLLVEGVYFGFKIGDVPVPVRYHDEASSINMKDSLIYGIKTLGMLICFCNQKLGLRKYKFFERAPQKQCAG